jgi:hypothetical protein
MSGANASATARSHKVINKLLTHPLLARLLRSIGVDPIQYALLVDLFRKLSDRQEFEAGNGRTSLRVAVGLFATISAFVNLVVAFGPKPAIRDYVLGNFAFATFLLFMVLTIESINVFLNPVEASVLAHQPIRDRAYFAAKFTYLGMVVANVVFPISIVPALAGLNLRGASWLHPLTYLVAVYLLGVFIAVIGCGLLGFLFRVFPAAKVKNAVLWVQIFLFGILGPGARVLAVFRGVNTRSTALPLNWFVFFAAPSESGLRALISWPALFSAMGCAVFMLFGIRSISKGYLTRVHTLLRSSPSRRKVRGAWFGGVIQLITGRPTGRAAFAFVFGMVRTDWQFRRTVYPPLFQFTFLPLLGLLRTGFGISPFEPGRPTMAHVLPHLSGILGLLFCSAISVSNQHRAAWIFLTFPHHGIRSFVRGVFWSLWLPMSIVPLLFVPFLAWRWGVADAALFAAYCLAVGSMYLSIELLLIDGLPFANPPENLKASLTGPLILVAIVGALIVIGLQWIFIFQSRFVTAGAVLVFAGAAYVVSQTSLRYLQTNVMHNLHRIASGRTGMFKEVPL